MDESKVPMSKHGYPILEKQWNQEIKDDIEQQGLEEALKKYTKEDVEHHIGGTAYGAEIGDDYVVKVYHFDNIEKRTRGEIEPILALADRSTTWKLVGTVLTKGTLIIQIRFLRPLLSSIVVKVGVTDVEGRNAITGALKLPLDQALQIRLKGVTDSELRGHGFTEPEIAEYKLSRMGFTGDDIINDHLLLRLIIRELGKIGVVERLVKEVMF